MSVEENVHLQPKGHKRYQEIVTAISAAIREGRYASGERLPGERELAKEFGVGRNAIREAMVALEVHGLVEAKHGAGLFIAPAPIVTGEGSSVFSAVEILTTRRLCEGEAAAQAGGAGRDLGHAVSPCAKRLMPEGAAPSGAGLAR